VGTRVDLERATLRDGKWRYPHQTQESQVFALFSGLADLQGYRFGIPSTRKSIPCMLGNLIEWDALDCLLLVHDGILAGGPGVFTIYFTEFLRGCLEILLQQMT